MRNPIQASTLLYSASGEAMQAIHDALKKEKDKELVTAADVTKTHEQGAEMYAKF